MLKLFPVFEDKRLQLKHDILISYALFLLMESAFIGYSTYNVGPDKTVFIGCVAFSLGIPLLVFYLARKSFKLVSILFITSIWSSTTVLLFIFKGDNSGMAYILVDLFIKSALASLTIRWYSGIYFGLATMLAGIADQFFEKKHILNFLQVSTIPPGAYFIGLIIMLAPLIIIAIANSLSFDKIFNAYQAELLKRKNAEDLLKEQNLELDLKVKERTGEIQTLNEELQTVNSHLNHTNEELVNKNDALLNALEQLQKTQEQLVQSEKMASLGVLASGIAHEINNPLNFIASGIYSLENYLNEKQNGNDPELEKIRYVLQTGLDRSASIITSLNRYSRKDDAMRTKCNIHAIIDSCLLMLHNQTKHRIVINKNYTTDATIICHESKMHQAFLNILANAVQSIENAGTITIDTMLHDNRLQIIMKDTGCGIEKENLSKIFDPFYTTKDPGKGTGLGLSITYSILKEHSANIEYKSEVGKGTTVIMQIPTHPK